MILKISSGGEPWNEKVCRVCSFLKQGNLLLKMHSTILVVLLILVFGFIVWWYLEEHHKKKTSGDHGTHRSLRSLDVETEDFKHLFAERPIIELPTGEVVEFRNLDNAASTSPFKLVAQKLNDFIPYYSGVHRGSGFNSQLSTAIFDKSIEIIMDFVGADSSSDGLIMGKNTSESINKLAMYCKGEKKKKIVITMQEHHSNLIPWMVYDPEFVKVDKNGVLDLQDLEDKLENDDVLLVSVTGASNVSGIVNDIEKISDIVHRHGAFLSIDGAQLVPHRPVNMRRMGIDFLCFSAHKMYAPYGVGVLIGPKSFFAGKEPVLKGGGEVEMVTPECVYWKDTPDKDNEGSPNTFGIIALAESCLILNKIGMDKVEAYEDKLIQYAIDKLREIPEVELTSYTDETVRNIGIVTFTVRSIHYNLVGSILNYEFGIGCRCGCYCSAIYTKCLLGLSDMCVQRNIENMEKYGDKRNFGGMVRFSIGLGVTKEDIDYAIASLKKVIKGEYKLEYDQLAGGEYLPVKKDGMFFDYKKFEETNFKRHFSLG